MNHDHNDYGLRRWPSRRGDFTEQDLAWYLDVSMAEIGALIAEEEITAYIPIGGEPTDVRVCAASVAFHLFWYTGSTSPERLRLLNRKHGVDHWRAARKRSQEQDREEQERIARKRCATV
jgi:hypothetical protein